MANSKNNEAPFGETQTFVQNYMAAAANGMTIAEFCEKYHKSGTASQKARAALSQKVATVNGTLEKNGVEPLPSLARSARTGGVGASLAALVRKLRNDAAVKNETANGPEEDDEEDDDEDDTDE